MTRHLFKALPLFLLAFLTAPHDALAASARSAWPASCSIPHQGVFKPDVVNEIDCNISTAVFPGTSATPIQVTYGENSYCYFIDNTTDKTFFVPMRTEKEWLSFINRFRDDSSSGIKIISCDKQCGEDKPAISFVIDESGSIGAVNFALVQSFFNNVIDTLDYVDQSPTNVIFFSDVVRFISPFRTISASAAAFLKQNYKDQLAAQAGKTDAEKQAIADAYFAQRQAYRALPGNDQPVKFDVSSYVYVAGQKTSIGAALSAAVDQLMALNYKTSDGKPGEKMIVIFTDGNNNVAPTVEEILPKITANKIKIFVVGVGYDYITNLPPAIPYCQAVASAYYESIISSAAPDKPTAFDYIKYPLWKEWAPVSASTTYQDIFNGCIDIACKNYVPGAPVSQCKTALTNYYFVGWQSVVSRSLLMTELSSITSAGLPDGLSVGSNYRHINDFVDLAAAFKPTASDICAVIRGKPITK